MKGTMLQLVRRRQPQDPGINGGVMRSVFFKGSKNVVRDDLPGAVDDAVEQGWGAKGTLAEYEAVFSIK